MLFQPFQALDPIIGYLKLKRHQISQVMFSFSILQGLPAYSVFSFFKSLLTIEFFSNKPCLKARQEISLPVATEDISS